MVCSHSRAGVAPGAVAQSRSDGVGSGSSRYEALPQRLKIRVVLTGRRRGPFVFELPIAYGETPELRFWAWETRAGLARRTN